MTASHTQPNWRKTKLGDYFRIKHGYAFKGEFFSDEGPYVLLTPGNFQVDGGIKLKGEREKYYTGDFPKEFLLKRGDFLIVMTDLTQNAPILGSPALIKEDDKFLHNQRLGKIVELNESEMDRMFLYYLFNTTSVRAQIKASATGATVRHTAPDRIYAVKVEVPSLSIQRRIASILSAYDDLIENNTRRIKILEEMARLIYREWFVEFRAPGVKLRKAAPEEQKVMGKDVFPVGWEVKRVGDAIETLGGSTPSTKNPEYWDNGDITWFTPSDLTANKAMFIRDSSKKITRLGLEKSSSRLFPPYSVMMTSRATIGVTAINTTEACTNQGFITCIPNDRLSAYHIYFWIEQNLDQIVNVASGATYKEINRTEFRDFLIAVPDEATASQFVEVVGPMGRQIEILQAKNANLRQTRDLLLPKLVSGEVEVEKLSIG